MKGRPRFYVYKGRLGYDWAMLRPGEQLPADALSIHPTLEEARRAIERRADEREGEQLQLGGDP